MSQAEQHDAIVARLEDCAEMLQKTQINLRKTPKARLTKGYVAARIGIVDDYWISFKKAHEDLVRITSKAQKAILAYFVKEEFFIYEDLYNSLQGDLKDIHDSLTTTSRDLASPNIGSNGATLNGFVHLPKIQLPTFTSTYESWPAFKDLFSSLVGDNQSLSDVQKLHYLKTSVTGEAEALLKHIQTTSSNYEVAWNILNHRYGNKRLIINNIMKKLLNQKKLVNQSAAQIKTLIDTTSECLNNLKNVKVSTSSWDLMIIHLLVQKLDPETHKNWEEHVSDQTMEEDSEELPTWDQFRKFMELKFRTLELVTVSTSQPRQVKEHTYHVATPATDKLCVMCTEDHTLCHCKEFIKMEPNKRSEYVKNNYLCFNCLAPGHTVARCKLPVSCRICRKRHHSLLHDTKNIEPAAPIGSSSTQPLASQHVVDEKEVQVNTKIASHLTTTQGVALLATATVEATSEHGHTIPLRALIDQGSQATFISERATQLLKLKRQVIKGSVVGVGSTRTPIKHVVQLQIRSQWDPDFSLPIQAYVMSKQLTTKIPTKSIPTQQWSHIRGLNLADPSYLKSGSIDLLLGVREYALILQPQLIKGPPGTPCAQNTSLGWILFGDIYATRAEPTYLVMHHQVNVDEMKSTWELGPDDRRHLNKKEKICEETYIQTAKRNKEGRNIVKLPFNTYSPQSPKGNTKDIAIDRFHQLERKFRRTLDLKTEYTKVMNTQKIMIT